MNLEKVINAKNDIIVPETKAFEPRGCNSNYNPRYNKSNYKQQKTSFGNNGNSHNKPLASAPKKNLQQRQTKSKTTKSKFS